MVLASLSLGALDLVWILSLVATILQFVSAANPTDGFTPVPLEPSNFNVQKPYDVAVNDRYSLVNGVHKFWVYDTDKPFKPDSPTKPRTEIRVQGYDYSSGIWQFEGYLYIPSGTTGTSVMQILNFNGPFSTAMMLHVYNGQLYNYRSTFIEPNAYNRWIRVNVIHDVSATTVSIYINGQRRAVVSGRAAGSFYFKFGVYTQTDPSHYMESRWRDIKIFKK